MASQKFAERLLILKEHGEALLERLHNIRQKMKVPEHRPLVFREDAPTTKLLAKLTKEYPKESDNVEGVQGWDFVKKNITEVLGQMQPIFATFREVLEWTQHAQKTLDELCTSINVEFKADVNILIMFDFLSVMIFFAKAILMLNRIEERKLLLSVYNLIFSKINGKSDPAVPKVVQFFHDFEKPWPKIQETFFTIQNHVGRALLDLWIPYEKGELNFLTNKRPLEMLSEPDKIPYPSIDQVYFDLSFHDRVTEWILYGYLCCPEGTGMTPDTQKKPATSSPQQNQKRGLDLLFKVMNSNYTLPIYGDEYFTLQEPYEELFKKFKSSTIRLKKETKPLKAALDGAAQNAHTTHKEMRQYLRLQLKSLLNMLRDNPGLIGPKFQLVLSCLALGKAEIMWYFRHFEVPSKVKNKYKEVVEHNIGEMIFLMDGVSRICFQHKDIVSSYHREILKKLYAKKARDIYAQVANPLEGQNANVLAAVFADLDNATDFVPFRLNWKRLQSVLSGFQFKNVLRDAKMLELISLLNRLYSMSRHVDDLDRELVELTSLKELYFYQPQVNKIFVAGLTGKKTQPYYSTAFVRILQYYPDNVNKGLNPELRQKVGRESVKIAEYMLSEIAQNIQTQVADLRQDGFALLAAQVGGDKVANRLKLRLQKQREPPRAGFESLYSNRQAIEKMRTTERNITQLLFALQLYDEIQVYDTILYPSEFLRDRLEILTQDFVKKLLDQKEPGHPKDYKPMEFLQPSTIVNELRVYMNSLKYIEQCIHMNTEEIVFGVLLEHFTHLDNVQEPFEPVISGEQPNFVKKCVKWYVDWVTNIQDYKLIYTPLRKVFVSTKETQLLSYRTEDFLDTQELSALVELIGPYGVRCFENELLTEAAQISDKIRECLSANLTIIKEVEQNMYQDGYVETLGKKYKPLDNLLALSIRLGAVLMFRKHLHEILLHHTKTVIPVIHTTIKTAHDNYPRNLFRDERLYNVDGLAHDCGLCIDHADVSLKKKLAYLAETSAAWEVLPLAFSVLLTLPSINNAIYDVYLEGWQNNIHLSIYAFHAMMLAVGCYKAKEMKNVEREYERFGECSSQLLLQMRIGKTFNDKQVNAAYVYFDKIVKTSCGFLKPSFLENFNPYSLTRGVYVQTYEPLSKIQQGKTGEEVPL